MGGSSGSRTGGGPQEPAPDRRPKGDVYRGELAARYHGSRSADPKWDLEQAALAQLLRSVPAGSSVLDVPFGTGRFLPEYSERGLQVTGLDSSTDMLDAAESVIRELGPRPDDLVIQVGDALAMPFEDRSFDLVVCVRFLASVVALGDVPVVLAEIARVMRDFAIIQFRVPPTATPLPSPKRADERMEHQCDRADQDHLLERAGLKVIDEVWDGDADAGGLRLVLCTRSEQVVPLRALPDSWRSDIVPGVAAGD